MKRLIDMGVMPSRQRNTRGTLKPHLCLSFRSEGGRLSTFTIDSTRNTGKTPQPDAYLITHAHSDHYGSSAMLSDRAVCTDKTAKALEIRYERVYKGSTLATGDSIVINDVEVKTYTTGHTEGAVAFYWVNDVGTRILVTGDVKDPSALPDCDLLITEANYGDVNDLSCYFEDDVEGLRHVLESEPHVAFGAYAFGKAQRVVEMLRSFGHQDVIEMEDKSLQLTRCLLDNAGELAGLGECGHEGVCIVPPRALADLPDSMPKYVMTGRVDQRYAAISISDHLDARGLVQMVEKLDPEMTLVYHPKGPRPARFASHLQSLGRAAISLDDVSNIMSHHIL